MFDIDYRRDEMINDLKLINYYAVGYFSFLSKRLYEPSASDQRIRISKNYFKLLATKKKISLRDLDYYIKDKVRFAKWEPRAKTPKWYKEMLNA